MPSIARSDRRNAHALPIRGFPSKKNKLKVRYDVDRHISRIKWYERKSFEKAAKKFNDNFIYGEEGPPYPGKHYIRRREGEALCLPAALRSESGFPNTVYPTDIDGTCEWLSTRSFKTLQRAIHLSFPDTQRWWLDEAPNTDVRNNLLWRTYLWSFHPDEYQEVWWRDVSPESDSGKLMEPAPNNSMAFIVQSPWILAWQDLVHVSRCKELPYLRDIGSGPSHEYSSRQRVWSNVIDTCKNYGTHNFVLTTHEGWMFGRFSNDWEDVDVSPVTEYNARDPTVMQTLVYWVAASMGIAGTSNMPPAFYYTADAVAAVATATAATLDDTDVSIVSTSANVLLAPIASTSANMLPAPAASTSADVLSPPVASTSAKTLPLEASTSTNMLRPVASTSADELPAPAPAVPSTERTVSPVSDDSGLGRSCSEKEA